jgi:hypothetical protein
VKEERLRFSQKPEDGFIMPRHHDTSGAKKQREEQGKYVT